MAYQDYRKWITSNEANKSMSLREIFSIFGQGIVFVTIALAGIIFFTLNQHLIQQVKQLNKYFHHYHFSFTTILFKR